MRRLATTCSVMAAALTIAPATALARHHHSRHHSRAHHRATHTARVRRFGSDISTSSTTAPSSADTAGTVQSFQNGVLTILLTGGTTTVSGTVNDTTKLECMAAEESSAVHQDGDGGSGSSEDGAGGDNGSQTTSGQSSGDDQGDGAETGDDSGDGAGTGEDCPTMNLTPGTTVHEAELRVSSAGSIWSKVELGS